MQRRDFLAGMLAGLTVMKLETAIGQTFSATPVFERPRAGRPHEGKVLAAIQPHSDDVALLCAGTVAKLVQEGYTGYMIRATKGFDMQKILVVVGTRPEAIKMELA